MQKMCIPFSDKGISHSLLLTSYKFISEEEHFFSSKCSSTIYKYIFEIKEGNSDTISSSGFIKAWIYQNTQWLPPFWRRGAGNANFKKKTTDIFST